MGRLSYGLGLSWALLAAGWLLACGGSQPPAATAAEPASAPASEAAAGDSDVWNDSMPAKEKGAFMKKHVVPDMAKLFAAFDATKYANFGCKTCHGPDMQAKPVDFLPELHFKEGKFVESEKKPTLARFMQDEVAPQMAQIFGKKPYDPATNSGFGCGGCHKLSR